MELILMVGHVLKDISLFKNGAIIQIHGKLFIGSDWKTKVWVQTLAQVFLKVMIVKNKETVKIKI